MLSPVKNGMKYEMKRQKVKWGEKMFMKKN